MRWKHEILFSPRYSVVACHKLSHFSWRVFTLHFTWNCCRLLEAKKFSKNPGQFKWVTKKPDITYQSRNSYNGISWAKLWNYSKDLGPFWKYFIWVGTTIFSKIHQDRFSYDRSSTFLINWQGRHKLEPGRHFQQNYQLSPGHRGASHRGTWIERCNSGHF